MRLRDGKGSDKGVTIYNATIEKLLPFLIQSLKTAGYQGSWRVEDPSLTTQLLETVKSFDPIPNKPCCHTCHEPLKIGDHVISIRTGGSPNQYHKACYERTLH